MGSTMRERSHKYWDQIILLHLFDSVNRISRIDGNLKVQKLIFLLELKGQEAGIKAAHYRFFRYQFGPYSGDLAGDTEILETLGFITKSSRQLTTRGRFLLEYVSDHIRSSEQAKDAIAIADRVSNEYGRRSGPKLTDIVYAMKVPVYDLGGSVQQVRAITTGLDILDPVNSPLNEVQPFDESVLGDLEEEFSIPIAHLEPTSPSYRAAIKGALSRAISSTTKAPIEAASTVS